MQPSCPTVSSCHTYFLLHSCCKPRDYGHEILAVPSSCTFPHCETSICITEGALGGCYRMHPSPIQVTRTTSYNHCGLLQFLAPERYYLKTVQSYIWVLKVKTMPS